MWQQIIQLKWVFQFKPWHLFLWLAKKPNKQKKSRVFLGQGRPTLDGGGRSGPTLEETKKLRRQEQHNCHWPAARLLLTRVAKLDRPAVTPLARPVCHTHVQNCVGPRYTWARSMGPFYISCFGCALCIQKKQAIYQLCFYVLPFLLSVPTSFKAFAFSKSVAW